MNIAAKKVELIEWLTSIQDQALLEKIESLKQQAISDAYQAGLKPMTSEQYKSILDQAEEDYTQSRITSQQNIEKEFQNW